MPGDARFPLLRTASEVVWRVLVVLLGLAVFLWLLGRFRLVVLPVFIALLIAALLTPLVIRLEHRGLPTLAATWLSFLLFIGALVGIGFVVAPAVSDQFDGLVDTVEEGIADVEQWLVQGPLDLSPEQIDRYRSRVGDQVSEFLRNSTGQIVSGAVLVFETIAGAVLSLVIAFFFTKDGRKFQAFALSHLPRRHERLYADMAAAAWRALGAYLRGAALIGIVEGIVLGTTLALLGGDLALPVGLLTFLGAFFPIVGAVFAGLLAVLVALVSAGGTAAIIMGVVALVVQQFDNDLLAPLIYGRIIQLHPVVILVGLTLGAALGGIMGAFLAVPFLAVAGAVIDVAWDRYGDEWRDRDAPPPAAASADAAPAT